MLFARKMDLNSETVYQRRAAHGVVFGLAGFAEVAGRSVSRLEPCQPCLKIILAQQDIALGGLRDAPTRHKAFVVGPSCGPLRAGHDGVLTCVEIDLPVWSGVAAFGHPFHHEPLPLADLTGSSADRLLEALSDATDWHNRLALVEAFIVGRLSAGAQRISPEIRWAWEKLERGSGRASIRELADEIGWSGRHFGQRFRHETGILPKTAMRMMRFARASRLVEDSRESLADIAHMCGYADQSHMTREFLELAGRSPDAHRKARFPDLPGTAAEKAAG